MVFECLRYNTDMRKIILLILFCIMTRLLAGCNLTQPSLSGKQLQFETVDIDGNPVSSDALFAQHEITMLNLWATWCSPCVGELSELNEVNEKLGQMDGAVVGLLNDDKSPENIETAKRFLSENNVQYLNILAPNNMNDVIRQSSFPMTVFVNREGVIVGRTLLGTVGDKYIVDYYMDAANNALKSLPDTNGTGKSEPVP